MLPSPQGPAGRAKTKVIVAGTLGTALEFYDLLVYGTVAALVFGKIFFPNSSPTVGAMLSLSTLAVGFVARPVGAIVFGHLGDRIGRRRTLTITMVMMGLGTFLIGCLPTYQQIGLAAPVALIVLRVVQGIALGGEWAGAVLLIGEHSTVRRRGHATSFAQLGSPAGLLIANGVVYLSRAFVTEEQFLAWGWRIPFLLSIVLFAVGLYVRTKVDETPVFERLQETSRVAASPIVEVFRTSWRRLALAIGLTYFTFIGYGVFTTVGISFVGLEHRELSSYTLLGSVVGAALALPVVLLVGHLSDTWGRKPFYWAAAGSMVVWGFIFFPLLNSGSGAAIIVAIGVGVVTWALMYGVAGAYLPELFTARVRYSGASLAYQLTGVVGGFVPLVSVALLDAFGTPLAISVLIAASVALSAICLIVLPETAHASADEAVDAVPKGVAR